MACSGNRRSKREAEASFGVGIGDKEKDSRALIDPKSMTAFKIR